MKDMGPAVSPASCTYTIFRTTSGFLVKAMPNPRAIRMGKPMPQNSTPGSRMISLKWIEISCPICRGSNNFVIQMPSGKFGEQVIQALFPAPGLAVAAQQFRQRTLLQDAALVHYDDA